LYFRSSPYGSVNHGHADQNSFILNVGSKRTFINSGVDDYYWSPQYSAWYVQTKAHNAITYDGGVGQVAGSLAAKGQVTAFKRNAAGYTLTSGDAQKAYPSGMSQATRTILAGPDGSFVTVDQLAATSGRRWEYNLHVPGAATTLGSGRAQVNTDRGALCIQPVAASQSPTWWGFSQAKIPDMAVSGYGSLMGTYQMKWTAPSAVTSAVLPMHFDFGCNSPAPVVTQANSQITIQWDGFTWVVDSRGRLISAS
jgi:YD repeat-containing protein